MRKVAVGQVAALPGQRPAARGLRDVVGALADDGRRSARTAGDVARRRPSALEHAGARLDPQDAADGVVDPRRRDFARLHTGQRVVVQRAPVRAGIHEHVDPGGAGRASTVDHSAACATGDRGAAAPIRRAAASSGSAPRRDSVTAPSAPRPAEGCPSTRRRRHCDRPRRGRPRRRPSSRRPRRSGRRSAARV